MKAINQVERNTINSFNLVSQDIQSLKHEDWKIRNRLDKIEDIQKQILLILAKQFNNNPLLLVGNRNTFELHRADCILAKATDSQNLMKINSKLEAEKLGFKECICLY